MEGEADQNPNSIKNGIIKKSEAFEFLGIDEILEKIGQIGKLQIFILFIFSISFIVPGYQALLIVFIGQSPSWRCKSNITECNSTKIYNEGDDGYRDRCSMSRASWEFTQPKSFSVVTEFDLVCDRDPWLQVASSGLFIGLMIGGTFIGWLSDRYGRKKCMFTSLFLLTAFSLSQSFSPNIWWFIVLRIVTGIFHGGCLVTSIVMSVELVGPKYRSLGGLIIWQTYTIAVCFLSLQSYYIPNWRTLSIVTSAPFFVTVLGGIFVPESVRWLRSKNKLEQAEKILKRIANSNKKPFPHNIQIQPVKECEVTSGSFKDLISTWKKAFVTMRLCVMWFSNDIVYYGISLAAGDFTGSLHRDFVLISLAELPANLVTIWLIDRIGRRRGALLGYSFTSTALLTFAVMQIYDYRVLPLRVILGVLGKVFGLFSWCATSIWSSELYPTSIRAKSTGVFFVTSQFGSACAPWVVLWMRRFYIGLPFLAVGGLQIVAGLCAFTLTDTFGKAIEDVVHSEKDGFNEEDSEDFKSTTTVL